MSFFDDIEDTRLPVEEDAYHEVVTEEVDDLTITDLVVQCEDYGVDIKETDTIEKIRENLVDAKYSEELEREQHVDYREDY